MDDQQAARNLALVQIQQATANITCTDTEDMLRAVRQLRDVAEAVEDELMALRLADVPRFAPPR